jgi:pimeloyl-CoA synthetase
LRSFGFDKKRAMMNVKIEDSKGNKNEFDAVVIHKNTCYVIEDKTRNMKREGVADAAIYKLSQLSSQMGSRVKGILVSAFGIRTVDKDRARTYGVEIIDWLPDLKNRLSRILQVSNI